MVRASGRNASHFECRTRESWSPVPAKPAAEALLPQGGNAMRSNASLGVERRGRSGKELCAQMFPASGN